MRKLLKVMIAGAAFILSASAVNMATVYAKTGDMGFYGGISEGRKLPKTTEKLYKDSKNKNKKTTTDEFQYKELFLMFGEPIELQGTLKIKTQGGVEEDESVGTFKVTHTIEATDEFDSLELKREIVYDVYWRREGDQIIYTYEPDKKKWTETLTTDDGASPVNLTQSNINISFIEDVKAGVTYSKGTLSSILVYGGGEDDEDAGVNGIKVQSSGSIYGYSSAWSSVETQRINTWVYGEGWQMQYQFRPSVSVAKQMQYSENEPTAISFTGNYTEIIENTSVMSYNIYNIPNQFYGLEESGSMSIDSFNYIEQLIAPDVTFLKGHWAEEDIKKLFSMAILTGPTKYVQPDQAMTRGQYVEALSKAVKLKIEEEDKKKSSKKNDVEEIIFPDVLSSREEYPYIMAAYKAGLAIGRDSGNFYIDSPIQRQEAIAILIRTIGLEHLGLDPSPVTPYVDDAMIGDWAKKEINAARIIGVIGSDSDGKLNPTEYITKAEGAAMVNRLIEYMRGDMIMDYTEHIINYAD